MEIILGVHRGGLALHHVACRATTQLSICLPRIDTIGLRCCTIPTCENARRRVLLQDSLIGRETLAELVRDPSIRGLDLNVVDSLLFQLLLVGVLLELGSPVRVRVALAPDGRLGDLLLFQKCRTLL